MYPQVVASGCSGLVTESRALKDVEINAQFAYLCDPDLHAWNFCKQNGPPRCHYFRDLAILAKTGQSYCFDHQQICQAVVPQGRSRLNSKVTGFGCQPFSTSSKNRPSGTSTHPEGMMWENWIDELLRDQPDESLAENVFGLLNRESKDVAEAPIHKMLASATERAPMYSFMVFFVDQQNILVLVRRRVYIHAMHSRVGGQAAHSRMTNYVKVM